MGNLLNYLSEQGDITFLQSEFNEVDNLILSYLAYINLDDIVPSINHDTYVTVEEASKIFFSKYEKEESISSILKLMAKGNRFKNAKLSKYINILDEDEKKQFAALCIELDDNTIYVAFRGTDNHIMSWHEDFKMSYKVIPSQKEAVIYLENTIKNTDKLIRLGGHSKGGNLAVYAGALCKSDIKNKILEIYNNDGPGFTKKTMQDMELESIKNKIKLFIPEYSIFGMLFNVVGKPTIVSSSEKGIMQHDGMSWNVSGIRFKRVKSLTKQSKLLCRTLNNWINSTKLDERKMFTKDIFKAIDEIGINDMMDILNSKDKKIISIIKKMRPLEKKNRSIFVRLVKSFVSIQADEITYPIRSKLFANA